MFAEVRRFAGLHHLEVVHSSVMENHPGTFWRSSMFRQVFAVQGSALSLLRPHTSLPFIVQPNICSAGIKLSFRHGVGPYARRCSDTRCSSLVIKAGSDRGPPMKDEKHVTRVHHHSALMNDWSAYRPWRYNCWLARASLETVQAKRHQRGSPKASFSTPSCRTSRGWFLQLHWQV